MSKITQASRILMGLIYLIFGLNGFFLFIPVPEQSQEASIFLEALINTGYMLYFWKSIEVISGVLLLLNKYTLFAAMIALPVTMNILAFHLFLDPENLHIGLFISVMNIILLVHHKDALRIIFTK